MKSLQNLTTWTTAVLTALICKILYRTYRIKIVTGQEIYQRCQTIHPQGSYALALWHQSAFCSVMALAWRGISMLVSQSDDGDLTAHIGRHFGFHGFRGSSSQGGAPALRTILKSCKNGLKLGITIDGPRGPLHHIKPGILLIGSKGQIPIVPFSCQPSRYWQLKSWDQHLIAKPFATIAIGFGEPILLPLTLTKTDQERIAGELSQRLHQLTKQVAQASRTSRSFI